jgi:Insertion element 4 transposase N-terminal/Transposase DDE domain
MVATKREEQQAKRKPKRGIKTSTLAPGEAQRILDKIVILEKFIGQGDILQALQDTDSLDTRRCRLTREVTFWIVLVMGLAPDLCIRQVFKLARRLNRDEWTPTRAALCKSRQRLGAGPVRLLYERLARPLAKPHTPGAFYKGWRLMAIDSSVFDVPDSEANAKAFGYPQGGRGAGAFPQVRKLSLEEVGTHAEVAFVLKGLKEKECGEKSMVPGLLRHLRPGMLLLWDRGFFSYNLWQQVTLRDCHLLARVSERYVLRPLEPLGDGSYLAKIYPRESERNKDRHGIKVRVIRYTLNDPNRVGYRHEHVLLTTLFDAEASPALELIELYHKRWEIELMYAEQKKHQTPRQATKPAHLRSQTPLGVIQEMYGLALAHYLTRLLMAEAAEQALISPLDLSFVGCFQTLRCRAAEYPAAAGPQAEGWYRSFLRELARERLEPRRNRINPRVIKRKMSKFKKKRLEHRGRRPLERNFKDTIVVTQPITQQLVESG